MTIRHRSLSALLIAGIFGLAASASAEVHGNRYGRIAAPLPPVPSDVTIEDRVHAELEATLGASADDIDVTVVSGVVYLNGYVATETERRMAHDAVYNAEGVRGLSMGSLRARSYR